MTPGGEALPTVPTNCFGRMLRNVRLFARAASVVHETRADLVYVWVVFRFLLADVRAYEAGQEMIRADAALHRAELRLCSVSFHSSKKG